MSMSPEDEAEFRRRRRGRNIAVGLLLGAFVVLLFFISIVKIGAAV